MHEILDLLGDPIPEGFGKRGRPEHRVTEEKRKLVMQLQAFAWSQERIAAALSITPPTLRKNYFRELRAKLEARARVEAALLGRLFAEADAGSVSAIEKYLKRLDKADLGAVVTSIRKPTKLGKKDQARADARAPATGTALGDLIARAGKPN